MLIDGTPLERPAPPLDDLLRIGLEADPEAAALVSAERSLTWSELEDGERRGSPAGYRGLGLEPGDRVASLMPNRVDLVVHYLACFKAGLIATPLNYRYTHREIDHALAVSGARALLAHVERGRGRRGERAGGRARRWGRSPTATEPCQGDATRRRAADHDFAVAARRRAAAAGGGAAPIPAIPR